MALETHLLVFGIAAIVFTVFAFGWGEYVNRKEAQAEIVDSSTEQSSRNHGGEE